MLRTLSSEKRKVPLYAAGLIAISFALGLFVLNALFVLPVTTDAIRYNATALHIIETGEMLVIDGQILPPGYPYFLAAIYTVFGHSYEAVYLMQFLLVGICGALAFYVARTFFKLPYIISMLIGLLVIVWPYMVLYATLLLSEILGITLLLTGVVLFLHYVKKPYLPFLILSGFTFAIATLVRPVMTLLPFWIVILASAYLILTNRPLPSWHIGAAFLLAFLFPLALWSAYLYNSQGSTTGFLGFAPGPITRALSLTYENNPGSIDELESTDGEIGVDSEKDYLEIINETKRPVSEVLVSKLKNVYRFWNPGAGGGQAEKYIDKYPAAEILIWLYRIGFFLLLALAFFSLRFWREQHIASLWIIILYFWGVHSVLYPYPRYMLPLIPLVLILAGVTIMRYKDKVFDSIKKST